MTLMFRDSELPERTNGVAAVIAEEGIRYVSDAAFWLYPKAVITLM